MSLTLASTPRRALLPSHSAATWQVVAKQEFQVLHGRGTFVTRLLTPRLMRVGAILRTVAARKVLTGFQVRLKSTITPLVESIHRRIKATGPISVADYMRESLLHPEHVKPLLYRRHSCRLELVQVGKFLSLQPSPPLPLFRATTWRTMFLGLKVTSSLHLRYLRCLERYVYRLVYSDYH